MATTCRTKKKSNYDNLLLTLKDLGLEKDTITSSNQIHSSNIQLVSKPGIYDKSDGLISKINSQLTLVIKTADCVPIFMYDSLNGVYALIHAGWKGVYKKIHVKAANNFFHLNSNPSNIEVFMGPSLKKCCFEIKEDLVNIFDNKYISRMGNKFYLDLVKCIIDDLNRIDISKININKICTYEDTDCYSYRKNKKSDSRMYSLIYPK
jgi:polyphenol oxidase